MKQFQFNYEGEKNLISNLKRVKQWCDTSIVSGILFQIYSETLDKDKIGDICAVIKEKLPDALYMGTSTNGNIIAGDISSNPISIVCTIYEYPSTKLMLLQYPLTEENSHEVARSLISNIDDNPWVKSVTTFTTMRGMSMTIYCEELSEIPPNIVFCGGGAFSEDINETAAFVFSSVGELSDHATVFLLTGGEDYYVRATHVTGWKPLGRSHEVTKASGATLYELDGKPAYDVYYRYLNIKNDENFFSNTLEFPFLYKLNRQDILRAPIASNEDGSLTMTADIAENVQARIAYGDPSTILEIVYDTAVSFQDFVPQAFTVFSCAARKTFWGIGEVGNETKPFQSLAPTSGFYTSGEFLRNGLYVNQHNVTLVIKAEREGDKGEEEIHKVESYSEKFSGKVSMINRLATFIQASTEELYEVNRKLSELAITDGLTKLFNRAEIQRRISDKSRSLEKGGANGRLEAGAFLIMMDIDNFKSINDTYGHKEGDVVLIRLAEMLKRVIDENEPQAAAGRWGGEEFMVLLPDCNVERATEMAELFRKSFSEIRFEQAGYRTMSVGVTELIAGESPDISCMRVDGALYEAKRTGKNKVVFC